MRFGRIVASATLALTAAGAAAAMTLPAETPANAPADTRIVAARDFAQRMTVPVIVNGAGPFAFLVDTAANHTVVSDRLAADLRLPGLPGRTLISITGPQIVPMAAVASLEVGGIRRDQLDAAVIAQAPLGATGILGIDNLADRAVILDFRRNLMTISRRADRADAGSDPAGTIIVTARRRAGQLILTDAHYRGHRIDVVVDTGAEVSIGNQAFLALIARRSPNLPVTTVTSVTGQTASVQVATLPAVLLDRLSLNSTTVVFGDLACFAKFGLAEKPAMLLGMDVLRRFGRVAIDFRKRRVSFSLPPNRGIVNIVFGMS